MRNLKKVLSVLVIVSMMLTIMAPALAVDTTASSGQYQTEAKALYDLKLFSGRSSTSFEPDLESKLTRQEAVIVLLKLFGEDKLAEAADSVAIADAVAKFKDVDEIATWAKNFVGYAVMKGYVSGYPDGTFKPTKTVSGEEYCTLIIKKLGYEGGTDFKFGDPEKGAALVLAVNNGLTPDKAKEFAAKPELKRDDFVGISYSSLKAEYKDKTKKTVADNLVKNNIVSKEAIETKVPEVKISVVPVPVATPSEDVTDEDTTDEDTTDEDTTDETTTDEDTTDEDTTDEDTTDQEGTPIPEATPEATATPTATPVVVSVASVSAVNGSINVVLDNTLDVAPVASDFSVTQAIENGATLLVTPSNLVWTAETKTVVLTVPSITATTIDQSVVTSVSYKSAPSVSATAFVVVGRANVTASEATVGSDAKVTITGDATNTTTVDIIIKNSSNTAVATQTGVAVTNGTFSYTTTAALSSGTYTYTVTPNDAIGAGAINQGSVVVSAPEVVSAKDINAKQVLVTFSVPVDEDSAESSSNYTGITLQATDGAVLQSDGKSVILNTGVLNVSTALTQYSESSLTVSGVKTTGGVTIPDKTIKFTPADVAIPTLVSATAKGNTAIELLFSEPVKNVTDTANFKLDDLSLVSPTFTQSNDGTKVTITLGAALVPGDHKISIVNGGTNKVMDYQSYVVPADVKTVSVTTTTAAATVASVVPNSQTKVTVVFSSPMNISTSGDLAKFFWNTSASETDSGRTADAIKKIDDKTYEISFTATNKPLTAGKVYFFVKDVLDFYGNKLAGNTTVVNVAKTEINVVANVAPAVKSITAKDDHTILVSYNADMNTTDTATIGNFTVTKVSDNSTISISSASYSSSNKETTLTTATMSAGNYRVLVTNVKDAVGTTMAQQIATITPTDTTAPAAPTTSTCSGLVIAITFAEEMSTSGAGSILNASNYQFLDYSKSTAAADLPSGTTLSATTDKKTVRITLPSTVTSIDTVNDKIIVGYIKGATSYNVADAAGNLVAPSGNIAISSGATAIDISADLASVEISTATSMKLKLTSKVFGDVSVGDFNVSVDGGTTWFSPVTASLDSTDTTNKTLILTISDTNKFTASDSALVQLKTLTSTSTTDNYGVKITASKTYTSTVANKIAAAIIGAVVTSSNTINVLFDAPVAFTAADKVKLGNSLSVVQGTKTFTGDGTTANKIQVTNIAGDTNSNKTAVITLQNAGADTVALDQALTVRTVSMDLITAKDANGNLITANTTGVEAASILAATGVTTNIVNKVASGSTISVAFNKNIDTKTVKTDWDGLTAITSGVSATFGTDGKLTINGVNVGTFEGFTVATQETVTANVQIYDSTNRILTVSIASNPSNVMALHGKLTYVANSNIKSTSATMVATNYKPLTVSSYDTTIYASVPATTGTTNSATALVMTFSEPVYKTTYAVTDGSDVRDSFTAAGGVAITSAIYSLTNKTVTFTLASAANTNTITHNSDTTALTDVNGNKFGARVLTYASSGTIWSLGKATVATTSTLGSKVGGTVGTIENGDTITLNFNEGVGALAIGTSFDVTVADGSGNNTVTIKKAGTSDIVATLTLTATRYNTGTAMTFNTSTGAWSNGGKTLTITLANLSGGTAASSVGAVAPAIVAGAAAVDCAGVAVDTTPVNGASSQF